MDPHEHLFMITDDVTALPLCCDRGPKQEGETR
jgi:hypothetical protein